MKSDDGETLISGRDVSGDVLPTESSRLRGGEAPSCPQPFLVTARARAAAVFATIAAVAIVIILVAVKASSEGARGTSGGGDSPPPAVSCGERGGEIVVLVSIDGLRYSYLTRGLTPNIVDRIGASGVVAPMYPSFPSKTFPNHYTIVTGLHPESHGIVANTIRDDRNGWTFSISNQTAVHESFWWLGQPLWVTAVKQGAGAATYFWPGSTTVIDGALPNRTVEYDKAVPYLERVDTLLSWIRGGGERFFTLYMSAVDTAGHNHGPDSAEVDAALEEVDIAIGALIDGIEQAGLQDCVNVAVVSDHGMAEVDPKKLVVLDDIIDLSRVEIVDHSPVLQLRVLDTDANGDVQTRARASSSSSPPSPSSPASSSGGFVTPRAVRSRARSRRRSGDDKGNKDNEDDALVALEKELVANLSRADGVQAAWRKAEAPARFFYNDSPRIQPVAALAEIGWTITTRERGPPYGLGTHGYDNRADEMRAIFVAAGPSIKHTKVPLPAFPNVDVYNAMCSILGLTPAPNNGSMALRDEITAAKP